MSRRRRRAKPTSVTLPVRYNGNPRARRIARELAALFVVAPAGAERPRTRGDCADGARPCPWVGCRHNLLIDVHPETGSIQINAFDPDAGEVDLDALPDTCALDVADRGGMTLEEVGARLGITRERARQVEQAALEKVRHGGLTWRET